MLRLTPHLTHNYSPNSNTAWGQIYTRTFNLRFRAFLVDFAADVLRRTFLGLWNTPPICSLWARALGGKIGHNCMFLDHDWIVPSTADLIDINNDVFMSVVTVEFETAEGDRSLGQQILRTRHAFCVGSGSELGLGSLFLPGCKIEERCSIGAKVSLGLRERP